MSINQFRQNFFGIRPNRFKVSGKFPFGPSVENTEFYIKAADLPGSSVGTIPVAWQGRVIKFSGERVYGDWAISVYDSSNPQDAIRGKFEQWMDLMDSRDAHKINYNYVSATDWIVEYDDIVGGTSESGTRYKKAIRLRNCWPTELGPVQLNYDLADTFSEFTVQLAFDFWEPYPTV